MDPSLPGVMQTLAVQFGSSRSAQGRAEDFVLRVCSNARIFLNWCKDTRDRNFLVLV